MAECSYVCLYRNYMEILAPYKDGARGRLMTAMLNYAFLGKEPEFTGQERFIWPSLRAQIDRDGEAYVKRCETNRENGKKGGRPRKGQENPQKTEGLSEEPEKAKEKENENENEKENEKEKETGESRKAAPRFSPPTAEEVREYCRSSGISLNPERFVSYYASIGWKVGKSPMKDWKAAVRTWKARDTSHGKTEISPYGSIGCQL